MNTCDRRLNEGGREGVLRVSGRGGVEICV